MAAVVALFAVAMAGDENPYDVLGVARDATEADIKTRFHKMALHFHPDRCGGKRTFVADCARSYA